MARDAERAWLSRSRLPGRRPPLLASDARGWPGLRPIVRTARLAHGRRFCARPQPHQLGNRPYCQLSAVLLNGRDAAHPQRPSTKGSGPCPGTGSRSRSTRACTSGSLGGPRRLCRLLRQADLRRTCEPADRWHLRLVRRRAMAALEEQVLEGRTPGHRGVPGRLLMRDVGAMLGGALEPDARCRSGWPLGGREAIRDEFGVGTGDGPEIQGGPLQSSNTCAPEGPICPDTWGGSVRILRAFVRTCQRRPLCKPADLAVSAAAKQDH